MKRKLLDNRKIYSSLAMLLVFGVVIHLIFLFDPESGGFVPEPLSVHRILNTLGFALLVLGVLSETTTLIGVDFYEEGAGLARFAHYQNVIIFKFVIFLVGLVCIQLALMIDRNAVVRDEWESFESIRVTVGIGTGLVLIVQLIRSLLKLVGNRADYLEVSGAAVVWYDNEVGSVLEIKSADLASVRTIFEDSQDSPDVEKFELTDATGRRFEINLATMSLLPQGRKILETFRHFYPDKTDINIS